MIDAIKIMATILIGYLILSYPPIGFMVLLVVCAITMVLETLAHRVNFLKRSNRQ